MNSRLYKTRFAEAGGVALGYLDTKYRPQDVVGVHEDPRRASRVTTLPHGLRASFCLLHSGRRACAQGWWWAGLPRVVGPFRGAKIGEGPRGQVGRSEVIAIPLRTRYRYKLKKYRQVAKQ